MWKACAGHTETISELPIVAVAYYGVQAGRGVCALCVLGDAKLACMAPSTASAGMCSGPGELAGHPIHFAALMGLRRAAHA